ncbi:MAG: hypothetical protein ACP5J4_07275 [Anaerolineae bacterium]
MTIDFSVPRELIPWQGEGDPGPCPKCGAPLKQHNATYMVLTRHGDKLADSFMTGSDKGWFCTQCPALLLNTQEVAEPLAFGLRDWDIGDQYAVVGIVDLNAVPPEKHHLPIGAPGNPVPLVEFSNVGAPHAARGRSGSSRHPGSKKRRKKRRRRH